MMMTSVLPSRTAYRFMTSITGSAIALATRGPPGSVFEFFRRKVYGVQLEPGAGLAVPPARVWRVA